MIPGLLSSVILIKRAFAFVGCGKQNKTPVVSQAESFLDKIKCAI